MRQQEAKDAIFGIWDELGAHAASTDATVFWLFLQKQRPDLLAFRTPGSDTREAVKSWLIESGRLRL